MDVYVHLNTACLCVQGQSLNWEKNENVGAKEGFLIDFPVLWKQLYLNNIFIFIAGNKTKEANAVGIWYCSVARHANIFNGKSHIYCSCITCLWVWKLLLMVLYNLAMFLP